MRERLKEEMLQQEGEPTESTSNTQSPYWNRSGLVLTPLVRAVGVAAPAQQGRVSKLVGLTNKLATRHRPVRWRERAGPKANAT